MLSKLKIGRRAAMRPLVAAAGALAGLSAMAQTYPSRPIRMIFPAAPGSSSDLVGRQVANAMQVAAGVPVVADNRAGANGVIGVQAVTNAPADGYSLLFTTMSTMAVNKALIKALPYEPQTSLIPLAIGYRTWLYVVVSAKLQYQSIGEILAAAKKEPSKFNFGYGTSIPQMAGRLLEQRTGAQFTFVPYKSHPMMMQALIAGEVDLTIVDPLAFGAFVKAGQLRLLGSASPNRLSGFGDIPTLQEAGVSNFELSSANICMVKAGTSPEVNSKVTQFLMAASKAASLKAFLDANYLDSFFITGAEAKRYLAAEIDRWSSIAQAAGLQPT